MKRLRWLIAGFALLVGAVAMVRVLHPLPPLAGRTVTTSFEDTSDTSLGRALVPQAGARPGLTGIHMLPQPHDAFAARAALARAAERSLDLQYYIWNDDLSGRWLFEEVAAAADRGVRVRLLLDDNTTAGQDGVIAALESHPSIEVRLFNPFPIRAPRFLGYLTDFPRLNRRMHNKSFTADNQVTIVGGRNVGDEYFGAADDGLFIDLDVAAVGAVVGDVSAQFDRYWASASAYPAQAIVGSGTPGALDRLRQGTMRRSRDPLAVAYARAIAESGFARGVRGGNLSFDWARATLLSDEPAKGLGKAAPDVLLWTRLAEALRAARSSVRLVSGYFVPARDGTDVLTGLARRGVDVQVATNSFAVTDVPVVHAGYSKRRKSLLRAGVHLYEVRPKAGAAGDPAAGTGAEPEPERSPQAGSRFSGAGEALHAKTFTIDGKRLFVGSFNFDPRSARLNTEMGLLIESTALAQSLDQGLRRRIPASTYSLRSNEEGRLTWVERGAGSLIVHDEEPHMSFIEKTGVALLSLLPIEWLL